MAKKNKASLSGLNAYLNKKFSTSLKNLYIFLGVVTALITAFALYFELLPFSIHSSSFRFFIIFMLVVWSIPLYVKYVTFPRQGNSKLHFKDVKIGYHIPLMVAALLVLVIIVLWFFSTPLFMASGYRNLITIDEKSEFSEEIENYTEMKIPVVDKALAMKLGEKKLGEDNYGSQYAINDYTIISYNNDLYWVGVIEHDGFFKWISNASIGSPGYVLISATNPNIDVQLVKTSIIYEPAAYFSQDLERKFYFSQMGLIRDGRINFELDDEGNPYYTQAVVKNRFNITNGLDSYGVLILNAVTGISNFYEIGEEPSWVDRVIPTEIANEQINYWGTYKYGFFNTLFAKREVLNITDGYNYVYHNGNLHLYTGLTSVGQDESVVGIVLCNLKTKQTDFYKTGGATEYAAQMSAAGVVQDLGYYATFPCLINYGGEPTYFMALKDNEGLIKKYAYVNLKDYTKVGIGDTMIDAQVNYNKQINIAIEFETLTVSDIKMVSIDGTSVFYIKFTEKGNTIYQANIQLNKGLAFLEKDTQIQVRLSETIISEMVIQ